MAWWNDDWHFKVPYHYWGFTGSSGNSGPKGFFLNIKASTFAAPYESGDSGLMDVRFVQASDQTEMQAYRVFSDSDVTGRGTTWFICDPYPTDEYQNTNFSQYIWVYYGNTGSSDNTTVSAFAEAGFASVWFFDSAGPTFPDLLGTAHFYEKGEALNAYATNFSHPLGLLACEMSSVSQYLWCPEAGASHIKEDWISGLFMHWNEIFTWRRGAWFTKGDTTGLLQKGGYGIGCRSDNPTYQEPLQFWYETSNFDTNFSPMLANYWYGSGGKKGDSQSGRSWLTRDDGLAPDQLLFEINFNAGAQGTTDSIGILIGKKGDTADLNGCAWGRPAFAGVLGQSVAGALDIGWRDSTNMLLLSLHDWLFTKGEVSGNSGFGVTSSAILRGDIEDLITVVTLG